MATYELEKQDHMRNEIKRIPADYLENLGSVSDTPPSPPADPFEGDDPFPMSPYRSLFTEGAEIAEALVAGTEIGEEIIDFSRPMLRPCPYCHSWAFPDEDADTHLDAAQCICKE